MVESYKKKTTEEAQQPVDVSPIQVYCRLKPCTEDFNNVSVITKDDHTIKVVPPLSKIMTIKHQISATFERVFPGYVLQNDIYRHVAHDMVEDLVKGIDGLLFTYGVTGSGKTYTLCGSSKHPGILTRCLNTIFQNVSHLLAPPNTVEFVNSQVVAIHSDDQNDDSVGDACTSKENDETTANKSHHPLNEGRHLKLEDVDQNMAYTLFVSFVEVYNNYVFDLLDDEDEKLVNKTPVSKALREGHDRKVYVSGVTEVPVYTSAQALEMVKKGKKRRRIASTLLNRESSRSHSIITLNMIQIPVDPDTRKISRDCNKVIKSQLALCDLAGSERTSRTNNDNDRLKEASSINSSLMTLRACIDILKENQKGHQEQGSSFQPQVVPYRDSKLTFLMRNFFEGDGLVRLLVCINPSEDDYEENLHVVRFAQVSQEVTTLRSLKPKYEVVKNSKNSTNCGTQDNASSKKESKKETAAAIIKNFSFPLAPNIDITDAFDPNINSTIVHYLKNLREAKKRTYAEIKSKGTQLKSLLETGDEDVVKNVKTVKRLNRTIKEKDQEMNALKEQNAALTKQVSALNNEKEDIQASRMQDQAKLSELKKNIRQEREQNESLKNKLEGVESSEKQKWEKACSSRVLEAEREFNAKILEKTEKLRQVKQIVESKENKAPGGLAAAQSPKHYGLPVRPKSFYRGHEVTSSDRSTAFTNVKDKK